MGGGLRERGLNGRKLTFSNRGTRGKGDDRCRVPREAFLAVWVRDWSISGLVLVGPAGRRLTGDCVRACGKRIALLEDKGRTLGIEAWQGGGSFRIR